MSKFSESDRHVAPLRWRREGKPSTSLINMEWPLDYFWRVDTMTYGSYYLKTPPTQLPPGGLKSQTIGAIIWR